MLQDSANPCSTTSVLFTCASCVMVLQDNAKTMKVQLDAQLKAVDQLKGNTRMLENKLAEAKSKKDTLKARAKSASTSKQINEMLQGLNTSSASSAFDRMEEKVMALEGESEAAMQVCNPSSMPLLVAYHGVLCVKLPCCHAAALADSCLQLAKCWTLCSHVYTKSMMKPI